MVSELHCTMHHNADVGRDSTQTICGEEEGKGDAWRLAVAAGQAFDLCRQHVIIVVRVRPHYLG